MSPAIAQAVAARELAVFVRLHDVVAAIPASRVTRLVLASDARVVRGGSPCVVEVGGEAYPGWNLGELLGLAPVATAWVLVTVPRRGGELRVALGTGPCVVVEGMPATVRVPEGIFAARARAFGGAFVARQAHGAAHGLLLDPSRLFTHAELEASAAIHEERRAS